MLITINKYTKPDVKRVILETISTNEDVSYHLRPTTLTNYTIVDSVAWEWSFRNTWDETCYNDPLTNTIIQAFSSSAEFIGRPLVKI